jgi:hypothetical protein
LVESVGSRQAVRQLAVQPPSIDSDAPEIEDEAGP